ncbi:MAG: hypothetical protein NUW24_05140 [Anaerolineae bacterium]|jgi:hypothetical protein|nr:hypothetical protein [Anaerolineae bacterium]
MASSFFSPRRSEMDAIVDKLSTAWQAQGEILESILQARREERACYEERDINAERETTFAQEDSK